MAHITENVHFFHMSTLFGLLAKKLLASIVLKQEFNLATKPAMRTNQASTAGRIQSRSGYATKAEN